MSAINAAFSGPFKHQETISSAWERREPDYRAQYECKANQGTATRHNLIIDSFRYQLMDQAVQPATNEPLFFSKSERFTHIALDIISTRYHERVHIIYVATAAGLIKKLSVLPRTKTTCIIEIWQPEIDSKSKIFTMQYLKHTESLYVGTENSVIKIPAQHCSRHVSSASCMNAMDPYCGWNDYKEACTPPPNGNPLAKYWFQNATDCPVLTAPIDGGWSAWSEWYKCAQHSDDQAIDSNNQDSCLCRSRSCNNPTPINGGTECKGISTSVTNCTINGGWTDWSPWSACSQTCGIAVKTKRRTCGNPKPAHGGRICVGSERTEMYCSNLPPCPEPKQPPVDGAWGPWGAYSECSAKCGGGFRIRRRKCDDPAPQNSGLECNGCHMEYEMCNTHACPEIKKLGSWTPWLQTNSTTADGGHIQKRFRFSCRTNAVDANNVKVMMAKEETRTCHTNGFCPRAGEENDELGWSDWGTWSICSVECGGGQQFRTRTCERNNCDGTGKMARACNTHTCKSKQTKCKSENTVE